MIYLIVNISLLLTLSIFIGIHPIRTDSWWERNKAARGVLVGLLGFALMWFPFTFREGIVFDSRTILLTISGLVFGAVPTLIAAIMMIIMRLFRGGSGVVMGVATIIVSSVIGSGWHLWRFQTVKASSKSPIFEFLGVGFVAHLLSWLCVFLLPRSEWAEVIRTISFSFLLIYPLVTMALGTLLFNQIQRISVIRQVARSELIFKAIFAESPIGMSRTELRTRKILEVNDAYARFLGFDREEIIGHSWNDFALVEEQEETDRAEFLLLSGTSDRINMDKRYRTKDGRIVWANLTVSNLSVTKDAQESLGMIVDITERKEYEEKLLYISTHDTLTGLFSRAHYDQHIEEFKIPKDQRAAILLADVDGLKILNEAFGQSEGNRLLKRIAKIFQQSSSEDDFLARTGGDEFAFIMLNRSVDEYEELAAELAVKLSSITMAGGMEMRVNTVLAIVDEQERSLNNAVVEAEKMLATRKLFDEPPTRGNLVHTVINALHVRNKREEHHSRRVSFLSEQLGRAVGLSDEEIGQLRLAGLFHDIGKIAIAEEVLNKRGELTAEERSEMQRHVEIGYRLLISVEDMAPIAHIVLAHHERVDGKGYPRGLKGEAIPLHARIIAIADAYDAMTSNRTYQKQVTSREAAAEIKECSGTQFDFNLTKTFIEDVLFLSYNEV